VNFLLILIFIIAYSHTRSMLVVVVVVKFLFVPVHSPSRGEELTTVATCEFSAVHVEV